RKKIWNNENVEWWFAQNTFLFAARASVDRHPVLKREWEQAQPAPLALVHPGKYLQMAEELDRLYRTAGDIIQLVPSAETLLLLDGGELANMVAAGRRTLPFPECGGEGGDVPTDERTAIRELERLRQAGAGFLAVAWPSLWWLECYPEFQRYLRAEFRCVLENDRVLIFDLRKATERAVSAATAAHRQKPRRNRER